MMYRRPRSPSAISTLCSPLPSSCPAAVRIQLPGQPMWCRTLGLPVSLMRCLLESAASAGWSWLRCWRSCWWPSIRVTTLCACR
uniref:Secreted protein n=1 Tax=Macrostomum lignano TaxID=282301 RepID=A0A1I8FCA2_9PLAT